MTDTDKKLSNRLQKQQAEDTPLMSPVIDEKKVIDYEDKRRQHLYYAVYFSFFVVVILYSILIYWIFQAEKNTSAWHTTLALTIAPTTILLFVLKLLAQSESNEQRQQLPIAELFDQLINTLAEKFKK